VGGVGGVPTAVSGVGGIPQEMAQAGVGGAVVSGVGGAPQELPRTGSNNLELSLGLTSMLFGISYLIYWKRKYSFES
jgi:LPXTG-motif cell wall-anchored protein